MAEGQKVPRYKVPVRMSEENGRHVARVPELNLATTAPSLKEAQSQMIDLLAGHIHYIITNNLKVPELEAFRDDEGKGHCYFITA